MEEKKDYYQELREDKLLDRCQTMMEQSKMKDTIDQMVEISINKGISIIIHNAFQKTVERMNQFTARFQNDVALDVLKQTKRLCETEWANLKDNLEQIEEELKSREKKSIRRLEQQEKQAKELLIQLKTRPLKESKLDTFEGLLFLYVGESSSESTKQLARSNGNVQFKSEEEAKEAIINLNKNYKKAVDEFISIPCQQLPDQLKRWTAEKRRHIDSVFHTIRNMFATKLGMNLPAALSQTLDDLFNDEPQQLMDNTSVQRIVEKHNRFATTFKGIASIMRLKTNLDAQSVRTQLSEQSMVSLENSMLLLKKHAGKLFADVNKLFVEEVAKEIQVINEIADSKLWELTAAGLDDGGAPGGNQDVKAQVLAMLTPLVGQLQ